MLLNIVDEEKGSSRRQKKESSPGKGKRKLVGRDGGNVQDRDRRVADGRGLQDFDRLLKLETLRARVFSLFTFVQATP